eukprot:1611024-Rhodomonas_salina.1
MSVRGGGRGRGERIPGLEASYPLSAPTLGRGPAGIHGTPCLSARFLLVDLPLVACSAKAQGTEQWL